MGLLDWLWRLPDGQQHSIIAVAFFFVVFVPWRLAGWSHPAIVGWLVATMWTYSREMADADSVNRELLNNVAVLWPGTWHADSQTDFYWPLATNTALLVILEGVAWWRRRRRAARIPTASGSSPP